MSILDKACSCLNGFLFDMTLLKQQLFSIAWLIWRDAWSLICSSNLSIKNILTWRKYISTSKYLTCSWTIDTTFKIQFNFFFRQVSLQLIFRWLLLPFTNSFCYSYSDQLFGIFAFWIIYDINSHIIKSNFSRVFDLAVKVLSMTSAWRIVQSQMFENPNTLLITLILRNRSKRAWLTLH